MSRHPDPEPTAPAQRDGLDGLDLGPLARPVRRSLGGDHPGEAGTMLPPLIDHHVHLMIVGDDALRDTALAGVVDLGAPLDAIAARARRDGLPVVAFAGSFLTAPGGYPVGRPWAADRSAREIDAVTDALAHTPFTERLDDALIARAVAAGQWWISTLFVAGNGSPTSEHETALDNLARFHAAGGRVLYGTDLGNGDQPLGVNPDELAALVRAGLGASDLIAALTDTWPG